MNPSQFIKKFSSVLLYLTILYYLLPFNPSYLSYSSVQNSNSSYYSVKHESKDLSFKKVILKNWDSFLKKDKDRFDLDHDLVIDPVLKKISFTYKRIAFFYSTCDYSTPIILCNSNRGPPVI
jgi:hypothetical protein